MNPSIIIIKMLRETWIKKRIKVISRRDELLKTGDKLTATAVEFSIDSIQETISDLTFIINQIESTEAHQEMINKLINKN
tara:strand:+ start:1041 stop:1280 length:240 start_codon:yes stop_codon:yes gene_type:complete